MYGRRGCCGTGREAPGCVGARQVLLSIQKLVEEQKTLLLEL